MSLLIVVGPPLGARGVAMGLDKVGNLATGSDTWAKLTGLAPRSGFPLTEQEGDGVRLKPARYDLECQITRSVARTLSQQIHLGGVSVAESVSPLAVTSYSVALPDYLVQEPDTLLEAWSKTSTSNSILGGPGTYLVATPSLPGPKAMGVDKTVAQSVPANTETGLSGWNSVAGRPGTVHSSTSIVMRGGSYDLEFRAGYGSSATTTLRAYRNGTEVANATGSASSLLGTSSAPVTFADGDLLDLTIQCSSTRTVAVGPGVTYLLATPV